MRISDWSSDVCSSDLGIAPQDIRPAVAIEITGAGYCPYRAIQSCNRLGRAGTRGPPDHIGATAQASPEKIRLAVTVEVIPCRLRDGNDGRPERGNDRHHLVQAAHVVRLVGHAGYPAAVLDVRIGEVTNRKLDAVRMGLRHPGTKKND